MKRPTIINLICNDNKTLSLTFSTGEKKIFDVKPYISGSWFGELQDNQYFKSARIINDGRGIEWAHGQDIAPHELYELSIPFENV